MKNVKIPDEIHEELVEWVKHKDIKIIDIIGKIVNTGLMTEKYGLSFFQSIIEQKGYVSKDKLDGIKDELKKKFFEKGLKQGFEQGKTEGFKESQKLRKKSEEIKETKVEEKIKPNKETKKKEVEKPVEKIIESPKEDIIPQYDPDDIYGEDKNTRFKRLKHKRSK